MRTYGPREIEDLLRKGNFAQAETLLRFRLENDPSNAVALNYLGLIASAMNLPQFALNYFDAACKLAPDAHVPRVNLNKAREQLRENEKSRELIVEQAINDPVLKRRGQPERFLLIKAWGFGFWSDVCHVLGQLLVAEITGRIPVVHWGSNSLFGDGRAKNAFELYFKPVSAITPDDIQAGDFDFWPPKWNHQNLMEGEVNQKTGPFSRIAGLYLLSRPERVVVGDFYTGVLDLKPWIPANHRLYGLSVNELYRYLVRRYLCPKEEILEKIDQFYRQRLLSDDFISVHVRGSDKAVEVKALHDVNREYGKIIDRYLSKSDTDRIFLMTDDSRILDQFIRMYGNKVIVTDCQRTSSDQGIHYQAVSDRCRLGTEVVVDAYLAAKGRAFIGNGYSNPSLIVSYLKDWPEEDVYLHGLNLHNTYNIALHDW